MTEKDIEKMLSECDGLDMSHIKKEDALARAKQEMYFGTESAKEEKGSSSNFFRNKRFVSAIAGAAFALLICFGMIGLYNENFQTVYIDINPSVALKLNRFERVIGVEFLNEDAKALLSSAKLVGRDATDAVQTVISACDSAGYVKNDSEIYISASAKEEQKSEKLLQKLKGSAENMRGEKDETYSVSTYNAKKDEKKDFEKESISPAKYKLIDEIIDEDSRYTIEELKGKTMAELRDLERALDDDDDDDFDDRDEHNDRDDKGEKDDRDENKKPNEENKRPPYDDDDDFDDDDDDNKAGKKPERD